MANIVVIRDSLTELSSVIDGLMNRTIDFVDERKSGTHTSRCSRADLREIAGMMPPLAEWGGEAFTAAKNGVKERFALSNTQFSKAIDRDHLRMPVSLGVPTKICQRIALHRWS